jgi:hypothetical protein
MAMVQKMVDLIPKSVGLQEAPRFHIKDKWVPEGLMARLAAFDPRTELGKYIKTLLTEGHLPVEQANELLNRVAQTVVMESRLAIKVLRGPWSDLLIGNNYVEDYGTVSRKVVTDTGVEQLVDVFQSSAAVMVWRWHALGLGSTAEATTDAALADEITTAGYGSATRSSGTQTTGSAGPEVYETVGTVTIDSVTSGTPMVIEEHGIFKTCTVASTGLWDRSLTGSQSLSTGDSLQTTYDLTVNSGG